MSQMYVIGEDALSCALGTRLVTALMGWSLAQPAVNTKGGTYLIKAMPRYTGLAHIHPVLCLMDTDRGCAVELRQKWLPATAPSNFLLRLAVTESESWMMADREALAAFFDVAVRLIPDNPDEEADAKRTVLNLARRSRHRRIRQEVVSPLDASKPGTGYNVHLCEFINLHWHPQQAAQCSPSLARAIQRLTELKDATL
ncbi:MULTISPECIES: hypothetical protein [unclassified Pseudomonas]|uniref:hypothetical protein n=1 Tax=unclassified Pseudomonas TaxID=196821 RepID=UPI00244882C2|nr:MULTISPECIES: hypothetical protein [unclassified Pseudomonas]MDH0897681.1 hypothetical protein [Pseudomonas sp. GD03875]MDH1064992.1 hypothetical protein [Pseudomonas sp. GD03985]